jgi:rhodanese-related sulfurtransferase
MTDHLTSRAQRLIDEFEEGQSIRHGIARVLTHLANNYGDMESWYAVPASTLVQFAAELTAPTLLDCALGGDRDAARRFLYEAGFTDEHGHLRPPYQS